MVKSNKVFSVVQITNKRVSPSALSVDENYLQKYVKNTEWNCLYPKDTTLLQTGLIHSKTYKKKWWKGEG